MGLGSVRRPNSPPTAYGKPHETLLGRRNDHDDDVSTVAAGDLRCEVCPRGGTWGTTGAYEVGRTIMCRECAVKRLGVENAPGGEQNDILKRFELRGR